MIRLRLKFCRTLASVHEHRLSKIRSCIVPWDLRNRWSNCLELGMNIVSSQIYREGNSCADKLVNHGHSVVDSMRWDSLPSVLRDGFLHDKMGLPCYLVDILEGLGLVSCLEKSLTVADESWVMDSGCSYHMCSKKEYFETLELVEGEVVHLADGNTCKVQGMCSICLTMFDNCEFLLHDV
ncbi:heat-shock protein, partial [Trifolium medium]|nr:heat-shock protein [Trifolium medium]